MIDKECTTVLADVSSICRDLKNDWEIALHDKTYHVSALCKAREALKTVISDLKGSLAPKHFARAGLRYQISSLFLKESWEYLIADPARRERLHLVTGTITQDGTKVLSTMRKLNMKDQSRVYVRAHEPDSHSAIISLDEDFGHSILAMFHSHIATGENATSPSSTDTDFLKRMAQVGCDCLGGIFSLDGFVRFYALKDFELDVYGKGVTKVQDRPSCKIFQITHQNRSS
jgi:hypothetical protein